MENRRWSSGALGEFYPGWGETVAGTVGSPHCFSDDGYSRGGRHGRQHGDGIRPRSGPREATMFVVLAPAKHARFSASKGSRSKIFRHSGKKTAFPHAEFILPVFGIVKNMRLFMEPNSARIRSVWVFGLISKRLACSKMPRFSRALEANILPHQSSGYNTSPP